MQAIRKNSFGMRLLQLGAATVAITAALVQPAAAAQTSHLYGGGTATISQVAMNVRIGTSGSATGSFECLMAGRSAFVKLAGFVLRTILYRAAKDGSTWSAKSSSERALASSDRPGGRAQKKSLSKRWRSCSDSIAATTCSGVPTM